ncbi:hypothetical protein ACFLUT_02445 [Chloroflexota bacterium]
MGCAKDRSRCWPGARTDSDRLATQGVLGIDANSVAAIVKGPLAPDDEDIDRIVPEVVALSEGMDKLAPPGATVIIKPNPVAPMARVGVRPPP